MDISRISRRHLLQGGAALTLGTALGGRSALAADTTIGFIYVGSCDDYGYNQAHAQGAAALKKLPGVKVVEEEKVPETDAVSCAICAETSTPSWHISTAWWSTIQRAADSKYSVPVPRPAITPITDYAKALSALPPAVVRHQHEAIGRLGGAVTTSFDGLLGRPCTG